MKIKIVDQKTDHNEDLKKQKKFWNPFKKNGKADPENAGTGNVNAENANTENANTENANTENVSKDSSGKKAEKNKKYDVWFFLKNTLAFFIFPALTFFFLEYYTHNIFQTMFPHLIWFNLLFYWLLTGFLFFLTGRLKTALKIETIFYGAAGLANFYVYQFRSTPILPWDIYSLKTAASVSGNYDYTMQANTIRVIIVFVIMAVAEHFICDADIRLKREKLRLRIAIRIVGMVCCFLAIFAYARALHQDTFVNKMRIYNILFTADTMQYKDGTSIAFIMELKYINVQKPSSYSKTNAENILKKEESVKDTSAGSTEKPNIIVIMNEAFSDPGILCKFTPSEDYLPFVHSLEKGADNTITGNLNVSVLGGNTANTEFEVLTGNTMAFLTDGSVAYQQYIHRNIPSMVSQLNADGYQTISMHPYESTGWNRNKVYPFMGFSKSLFQEDIVDPEYIRTYISDQTCVNMIEREYQQKKKGQPMFLFNVTMQNHGGYIKSSDQFTPDISVEGVSDYSALSYISLIRKSDTALESLVNYFKTQKEKTIIVMFGDHQPSNSVVDPLLAVTGKSCATMTDDESNNRYKVPLIIWANYDIKEETGVELSANYLSNYVMEKAGVPLTNYQKFLQQEEKEFPVISAKRVADKNGKSYIKDVVDGQFSDQLNDYRILQYYSLFDWKKGDIQ